MSAPEERRRAAEFRASRRPIVPLPATQTAATEAEEPEDGPSFGEEGFGEQGAEFAAKQASAQANFARYQEARQKQAAQQTAVLAAEEEAQAARQFETERLAARRLVDTKAAAATSAASERARKEASRRAAQWMMRLVNDVIGDVALSETIVAPFVSFLIKNVQLFLVNIYNGGESVKIPGLQWIPGGELPRLEWWEVVYVIFLDIVILPLVLLLNPITLPIVVILGAGLFLS